MTINELFDYIIKNNIKLVTFCGKLGHGKSYTANQLTNLLVSNGISVYRIAFASYIKDTVRQIWNLRKDDYSNFYFDSLKFTKFIDELKSKFPSKTDIINEAALDLIELTKLHLTKKEIITRRLYQYIGTDLLRNLDADFHVKKLKEKVAIFSSCSLILDGVIIVDDVRFENEAKFVRDNDGILCKVVREDVSENIASVNDHISENVNLDEYVQFVVENVIDIA
jgi:hypothetical protein